jgi:hypothetical protein
MTQGEAETIGIGNNPASQLHQLGHNPNRDQREQEMEKDEEQWRCNFARRSHSIHA